MPTIPKDPYKEAGVDVAKGDAMVDWLKEETGESEELGGFAGCFRPDFAGYQDPILVSGTDGVGTKVLLACEHKKLSGLGHDLVGMCVNDLYTIGARPLFFLDYYATGALEKEQFQPVLTSIKDALKICDTKLLGGETAEMPGLYKKGHFDLAGFVVGVVEHKNKLGGHRVKSGNLIYALPSSGLHSNGFSLVRKWLEEFPSGGQFIDQLLRPTKIYHEIPKLLESMRAKEGDINALCHITGGGISGNLPRVLPKNLRAVVNADKIPTPKWMKEFFATASKTPIELEAVFNIGVGMLAIIDPQHETLFLHIAKLLNLEPKNVGFVEENTTNGPEVIYG